MLREQTTTNYGVSPVDSGNPPSLVDSHFPSTTIEKPSALTDTQVANLITVLTEKDTVPLEKIEKFCNQVQSANLDPQVVMQEKVVAKTLIDTFIKNSQHKELLPITRGEKFIEATTLLNNAGFGGTFDSINSELQARLQRCFSALYAQIGITRNAASCSRMKSCYVTLQQGTHPDSQSLPKDGSASRTQGILGFDALCNIKQAVVQESPVVGVSYLDEDGRLQRRKEPNNTEPDTSVLNEAEKQYLLNATNDRSWELRLRRIIKLRHNGKPSDYNTLADRSRWIQNMKQQRRSEPPHP